MLILRTAKVRTYFLIFKRLDEKVFGGEDVGRFED
jgi:hypothetical protein